LAPDSLWARPLDTRTDSQRLLFDATVAGSYLATPNACYLAVALNYSGSAGSSIREAADGDRFPRAA